ncbi:MAG: hypothetical protein JST54_14090 [Deltaproteobacteria bacterium]|nr:hypothetical protein [Deltaproteobacteria bacterium]
MLPDTVLISNDDRLRKHLELAGAPEFARVLGVDGLLEHLELGTLGKIFEAR